MSGYRSIIGRVLTKFKSLRQSGCINITINVQIWHWAASPRNSDWPWLLNESYFWARLNKGGLPYVTCSSVNRDFLIAIFSILKGIKSDHTLVLNYITFLGGGHKALD
jgi:hypothetical protein